MAENRRPPMPSLITTLGGTIAAVYSRCQSQRNYEFAMHTFRLLLFNHNNRKSLAFVQKLHRHVVVWR